MKGMIDETELARLEQLKEDSDNNRTVYGGDTIATVWYQSEAANAVPALVAEVRRLREKVEAWEWCNQVQHIYDNITFVLGLRQCAINELYTTLITAREAVYADRE